MAFKFLVVLNICIISFVAAIDYDYNNPNSQHETATQLNNIASDINSFSAATSVGDSQATPAGYDYTPKTLITHTTTPNYVQVQEQQHQQEQQQHYAVPAAPVEYWPPAKYEYNYGVNDAYTGDIKSHTESRDGNYVRGSYSVVDPDGFERIVTYTVDDVNGFNAIVNRKPYISNILKSSPTIELHHTDTQSTVTNVQENNQINSDVQTHDSYDVTPTNEHQNNGPYP